jgi:hypothetical protein
MLIIAALAVAGIAAVALSGGGMKANPIRACARCRESAA